MIAVLLFFALIAAIPAEAAGAKSAPLTIVAFGDSLTSGHHLQSRDAYPSVLQSKLKSAGLTFTVVNRGVSGDTTTRALGRFDAALAERPRILILELGVNDGLRGVPVPVVKANLEKMITAATQTAVLQIARTHRIDVHFAPPAAGKNLTPEFAAWLRERWAAAAKGA